MKIVVGLGNIGKQYEKTRHNVGFMTADTLADKLKTDFKNKPRFQAMIAETEIKTQNDSIEKLIIVKPTTYMNRSGDALALISKFYKASPEDILIIYDDIDLPLGKIRIRKSGSAGTHNGMKSIISALNKSVPRLRIGIQNAITQKATTDFVLSKFSKKELPIITNSINRAAEAVIEIITCGIENAMQKFN